MCFESMCSDVVNWPQARMSERWISESCDAVTDGAETDHGVRELHVLIVLPRNTELHGRDKLCEMFVM